MSALLILERIQQEEDRLSIQQKRVAQYILQDCGEAAFMTAAKLAEASGVSEATVIRFANRMGYGRYSQLQEELRMVVRTRLSQTERLHRTGDLRHHSSIMRTAIRSMRTDMHNIEQTLLALAEDSLREVVELLATARRVFVIGTHSEYGIACYFSSTLCWIRDQVYLIDETHSPSFDAVACAGEQDVILALSFPPYPGPTVRVLETAARRGVQSIAITDSPLSPLARRAGHCLYARDEKLFFADNSAPTVSLLSVILALVGSYDYERSSACLKDKQKYWEELGFYHQENASSEEEAT